MTALQNARHGTFQPSHAITVDGSSQAFRNSGPFDQVAILVDNTAASGTMPTLDLTVQWSNDNTTWFDADPADSFTQIVAAKKVVKQFQIKGLYGRLKEDIGGTSPSFTYSASAYWT